MKDKNILNALAKMTKLNGEVKSLLKDIMYDRYGDLSGLEINDQPNELFLKNELITAAEYLDNFRRTINYLTREVNCLGSLSVDENGRYCLNEHVYTCGSSIEFLFSDDDNEYWVSSRVEYTDNHYYIVGFKNMSMDNLTVRTRAMAGLYEF